MAISVRKDDITAVILAGGRGQRMGGEDKGLVALWGRPLLAHVLDLVRDQVGSVVISANRNLQQYREFGVPVIPDPMGKQWGPLAGMAAAMRAAKSPFLLTLACDTPCLPDNLVARLSTALQSAGPELSVAHDGQQLQNTIALIPCRLVDDLDDFLESGQRKVEIWLRQHKLVEVLYADVADPFLNVNSIEQLQALEAQQGCAHDLSD